MLNVFILSVSFLDDLSNKEKRKAVMQERKPVLEACDRLRDELANVGVQIKVLDFKKKDEKRSGIPYSFNSVQ